MFHETIFFSLKKKLYTNWNDCMLIWIDRLYKKWLENSLFGVNKEIPFYMLCFFFIPRKNTWCLIKWFNPSFPMFRNPYDPSHSSFWNKLPSSPPASPSGSTFASSEIRAGGKTCECSFTGNLPANFYFVIVLYFCFNAFWYKFSFVYPTWYRVSNFNLTISWINSQMPLLSSP